jgi:hypothetical protein
MGHSFFFPGEQYVPALARRAREAHEGRLRRGRAAPAPRRRHAASSREKIELYKSRFTSHGLFSRDASGDARATRSSTATGASRTRARDGRNCGVDDELVVLARLGCYADLTFAAAPDESQPRIVNQIYWPTGDLTKKRAYENGEVARVGHVKDDRLLMITGPSAIAARRRRCRSGSTTRASRAGAPHADTACARGATQNIHVEGRPEWVFVKAFTHGAPEARPNVFLGEPAA